MKDLRFYFICKAKILACYSFMEVSKRYESPGLEKEGNLILTTLTEAKVSAFFFLANNPGPSFYRVTQKGA